MTDARFEDGEERPLRLIAATSEDLPILSALIQDAVGQTADIRWDGKRRRLGLLLNRFRWEDRATAERAGRPFERVRALLVIDDVRAVRAAGLAQGERDTVFSLLTLVFDAAADGAGTLRLILAGDGELALDVDCLNVTLRDVTRPTLARAARAPRHE